MIMYFKMMEILTVYGLVKEQLFIAALAYLLDLSAFLTSPLLHSLFFLSLKTNEVWQSSSQTKPIGFFKFSDTTCSNLGPECPKLLLSSDINYLDFIWGQTSTLMVGSAWVRQGFCCIFKMSPNEHTEYITS